MAKMKYNRSIYRSSTFNDPVGRHSLYTNEYFPDLETDREGIEQLRSSAMSDLKHFFKDGYNHKKLWDIYIQPFPLSKKQCFFVIRAIREYRAKGIKNLNPPKRKKILPLKSTSLSDACEALKKDLDKLK